MELTTPGNGANNEIITGYYQDDKELKPYSNSALAFYLVGMLIGIEAPGLTIREMHTRLTGWGHTYHKDTILRVLKEFPRGPFTNLNLLSATRRIGVNKVPAKAYYITFKTAIPPQ